MKQPILKHSTHIGGYVTPDGRFEVERNYPPCYGYRIIENTGETWREVANVSTLAEARRLVSERREGDQ